jgi:hypothetical protein
VGKGRFRATMTHRSLEETLQAAESPVEMLRNSQIGPHAFPGTAEFRNWRDEQRAWRKTCVLFVQGAGPVPTIVGMGAIYLAPTLGVFFDPAPKQRTAGRRL